MKRCTISEHNTLSTVLQTPMAIDTGHEHTLSDQQIIELHIRFLTNGFQHIQVPSIQDGRELIKTLLKSLDYYHSIACLTESDKQLSSDIHDLLTYLVECRFLPKNLEQFFLEQIEFDFLWIELTPSLLAESWFEEFKSLIITHHIHTKMPIMCISYEASV